MINKSLLLEAGIGVGIVIVAAVAIFAFSPKKKVAKQETQPNAVVATVEIRKQPMFLMIQQQKRIQLKIQLFQMH